MLERQKEMTLSYCMEDEEVKVEEEYQKDLEIIENKFKHEALEQEKNNQIIG